MHFSVWLGLHLNTNKFKTILLVNFNFHAPATEQCQYAHYAIAIFVECIQVIEREGEPNRGHTHTHTCILLICQHVIISQTMHMDGPIQQNVI